MKITNYVLCHDKLPDIDLPSCYCTLGMGRNNALPTIIKEDKEKDNIASKNDAWSELTGIYWIWKNDYSDVVGINHYRRFFTFPSHPDYKFKPLTEEQIILAMMNYDAIVSHKRYEDMSNIKQIIPLTERTMSYLDGGIRGDIVKTTMDFLNNYFNNAEDKYKESWLRYSTWEHGLYPRNMMIMKRGYFNKYCEWLFDILFGLEKYFKNQGMVLHNREYGYISELLMSVWIDANMRDIKFHECFIYNTERKGDDWLK